MRFFEEEIQAWDSSHNILIIILWAVFIFLFLADFCLLFFSGAWSKRKRTQSSIRKEIIQNYKTKLQEERERDLNTLTTLIDPNDNPYLSKTPGRKSSIKIKETVKQEEEEKGGIDLTKINNMSDEEIEKLSEKII